ncbi:hypothetical protein [Staphylococcus xylosus]|uniref:hypothetical protein n=1 Tax=Staphylococcus xylosus TaxID=1288 RepID=UPI003F5461C4
MKKLSFMQMTKLGKILKFKELELFQQFDLKEQHRLYEIFKNDEEEFKQKFRHAALEFRDKEEDKRNNGKEGTKAKEAKLQIGSEEDLTKQLAKQGVHNPTETLLKTMGSNGIGADFGKLFTGFGGLSLNSFQQMEANAHKVDQKQMFMLIAQQDKTIKLLEEQNETLKQQNEQIINLLTQLVDK